MKRKITIYSGVDVKKEMGKRNVYPIPCFEDEEAALAASAGNQDAVFTYSLTTASLRSMDFTDKELSLSAKLAGGMLFQKSSFSSWEERRAVNALLQAENIEIYDQDVIKTYRIDGFCRRLAMDYLMGKASEELVEKVIFRKENTRVYLLSERAKKRVKLIGVAPVTPECFSLEELLEEKVKKLYARALKAAKKGEEE